MRSLIIALSLVTGCMPETCTAFTSAVEKCANAQGWNSQKTHQVVWETCADRVRKGSRDGSLPEASTQNGSES
mgnify:CR=1 FL=1